MRELDRINKILQHEKFIMYVKKIEELERERIFCKHNIAHFIDVARIGYILNLEGALNIDKETIYAAGLLHDIGRWKEYQEGADHALASKELAVSILEDCNFILEETEIICEAIGYHRIKEGHQSQLSSILYKADKLSRPCTHCQSINQCKRFKNSEIPILEY